MRRWTTLIAFGLLCLGCASQPGPSKEPRLAEGKEAVQPGKDNPLNGKPGGKAIAHAGKGSKTEVSVGCAAFSPDGKRIAVGFGCIGPHRHRYPQFKIWDVKTRKQIAYWNLPKPRHEKKEPTKPPDRKYHAVHFIAYISGGKLILTVESDNMCRIWKASEGKLVREFSVDGPDVWGAALTSDGKTLMRAVTGGFALWEVVTGQRVVRKQLCRGSVHLFDLSPDGKRAIVRFTSAEVDPTFVVYCDLEKDKALLRLDVDSVKVGDPDSLVLVPMLFSPDQRTVLATKKKGDLLGLVLCDAVDLKERKAISPMLPGSAILQAYTPSLAYDWYRAIFSPDGKKLLAVDTDLKTNLRRFRCRDLSMNKELWNLVPRPRWSYVDAMLAYSPTENLLIGCAVGLRHKLLVFINTENGKILGTIPIDGLVFDIDY
jgi:WD40 repeat protein